jgi:hypothetical protein
MSSAAVQRHFAAKANGPIGCSSWIVGLVTDPIPEQFFVFKVFCEEANTGRRRRVEGGNLWFCGSKNGKKTLTGWSASGACTWERAIAMEWLCWFGWAEDEQAG